MLLTIFFQKLRKIKFGVFLSFLVLFRGGEGGGCVFLFVVCFLCAVLLSKISCIGLNILKYIKYINGL